MPSFTIQILDNIKARNTNDQNWGLPRLARNDTLPSVIARHNSAETISSRIPLVIARHDNAEAISVGLVRMGIATLPLRYVQGFGSPQ